MMTKTPKKKPKGKKPTARPDRTKSGRKRVPRKKRKTPGSPRGPQGRDGQRGKLTPEVQAAVVEGIGRGLYARVAAQRAGIGYSTLAAWRQRGEAARTALDTGAELPADERPYLEFLEAVERADAEAEGVATERLFDLATTDKGPYPATIEFLSRRFHERWNPPKRVEMAGEVATRALIDPKQLRDMSDDDLTALHEQLQAALEAARAAVRKDRT